MCHWGYREGQEGFLVVRGLIREVGGYFRCRNDLCKGQGWKAGVR